MGQPGRRGGVMVVHDFGESLAYSHSQADQPWWEEVYRRAFPDMVSMVDLRHDGWHQRAGRDRAIVLSTGRTIYIDEKSRKEDWPDILVEIWSVYPKAGRPPYPEVAGAKPGWAVEVKDCDWLAYAIEPTRTCYLLPYLGLRAAVAKKLHVWKDRATSRRDGFRWCLAPNGTYDTISIAVPTEILKRAINNALTVTWSTAGERVVEPSDDEEEDWPPVTQPGNGRAAA